MDSFKTYYKRMFLTFPILLLAAALLAGCGGGTETAPGIAPVSFNGNTAGATITSTNGQELAGAAYQGATGNESLLAIASAGRVSSDAVSGSRILKLIETTRAIGDQIRQGGGGDVQSARFLAGNPGQPIDGDCGGSAMITSYVVGASSITANAAYSGFCDSAETDGATWTGDLSLTLSTNTSTNTLSYTVSFEALVIAEGGVSVTVSGDLDLNVDVTLQTAVATLNLTMRDDPSAQVFLLANYEVRVQSWTGGHSDVDITGEFYHPIHGKVTVSTPTTLGIQSGDEYPSSGQLRIDGASGYVTISAVSSVLLEIEIVDGTGTTVLGPQQVAWTSL